MIPFDKREGKIWYNNELIEWQNVKLHVLSHGLHYASCVFEGLRVYDGEIFKLEEHTERFFHSAKRLGMDIPYDENEINLATKKTVAAQNVQNGYIRPFAWRGSEMMAISAQHTKIHIAIAAWEWGTYFDPKLKTKGIKLNISKWKKPGPDTIPWDSKASGLYMINTLSKHEAERDGFTDSLMSFLECDSLQCKEYEDWSQKGVLRKKPKLSFESIIDNSNLLSSIDLEGIGDFSTDKLGIRQKFSVLSLINGGLPALANCNDTTNNPKNQDDLSDSVPPGFIWPDCIPPKVEVYGDGTKTAAMIPIVSSVDGSILTLQIIEKGFGYTTPPVVSIIDKTNNGGGAKAKTVIDEDGSVVDVYMLTPGEGYCPSTNVVPPKYPVTEGPGIGITVGVGSDGTNLDTIAPFITFTTPADDAVGV